jgi:P-type Ca2+ transporter type 2C
MNDTNRGLTLMEVFERFERFGPNELAVARPNSFLRMLWGVVREPMVMLLIACAAVYVSFGDIRETLILLASIFLVVGITLVQEHKTERALDALRRLSTPHAHVIRDGITVRIPSLAVVPDDLLVLDEGDRIAADAELISSAELHVDESLLTGESFTVAKGKTDRKVFASTLVVRGRGVARVTATGRLTEVGKIGKSLATLTGGVDPLRQEIAALVRMLAIGAVLCCLIVIIGWGWRHGTWREGLLAGLTVAMSLVPEEFPIVLTVFFALGAYRISRQQVLTRRLPAIESLGAATVLCVDKTGTLTENRMRVMRFITPDGNLYSADPENIAAGRALARAAALASPRESVDPVDRASLLFGQNVLSDRLHALIDKPLREYPLSANHPMLAIAHGWKRGMFIAVKGSPEAVIGLCKDIAIPFEKLSTLLQPMAREGLRILAVAQATLPGTEAPAHLSDVGFKLLGFLGMADPLRDGVPAAVKQCRTAGIRVVMITGDYPPTAQVIARQAGLREGPCLTGSEIDVLGNRELAQKIEQVQVFARVTPMHKLRIVQALRDRGEIVAMTGDGINDAPALKAAHIGIAMGGRGTDVAREAADLIVLDDNFVSIVGAIRLGRRIYSNLQKSLRYLLAIHVPIAGMALLPIFAGWPLFFFPIHIVFLELVIDPACSLVFEAEVEEEDTMAQAPRHPQSKLLPGQAIMESGFQGLAVLAVTAMTFWLGLRREAGALDARTLAFVVLLIGNLLLIFVNRSRRSSDHLMARFSNPAWWVVAIGATLVLLVILTLPFPRQLFHFSVLHRDDIALAAAACATLFGLLRLIKIPQTHLT